jgi:hypothetical protein
MSARRELLAGREALERAERLVLQGDASVARDAFEEAEAAFARAADSAGNPLLRLSGAVPFLGRTPDAARTFADIGGLVAEAGGDVTDAMTALPGGLSSLAPSGGRIPIEALQTLAPAVRRATGPLARADELARSLPRAWVPGSVVEAGELAGQAVGRAVERVGAVDALLQAMPAFAGENGVRRYFVAAQNPAELRGTGGFIGAYAILSIDRGRIHLGPFDDISTLPNLPPSEAPVPPEGFADMYGRFGGTGFWRNINMTPDAPTAALLIESLYRSVRGVELDGTIFVDPVALAELVEATGPVEVSALGRTLSAEDVVPFLSNEAYFVYDDAGLRKRALGLAAHAILETYLAVAPPEDALPALVDAAVNGHLALHAVDPEVQEAFRQANIAGELGAPGGDFVAVFASNAAGNKVDFYGEREVRYEVSLGAGGTAAATVSVRMSNDAPEDAEAGYALGPYPGTDLGPGDNLSFVSVYCARSCSLSGAVRDGLSRPVESHLERGHPAFSTYVRVDAQGEHTIGFSLQLAQVWEGDRFGGTYHLRFQGQPMIRPTDFTLIVRAPSGMEIVATDGPMRISGDEAVWEGPVSGAREFSIRFQQPWPERLWSRVWDVLSRPVVEP